MLTTLGRRVAGRLTSASLVSVALMIGSLVLLAAPAGASPTLNIQPSTATNVGLRIWATSNVHGASTVTFSLYGPGDSSCASPIFNSTVAVTSNYARSADYTTPRAGDYRWRASSGGTDTSCSDPAAVVTVSRVYTGLSVSAPTPSGGTIHATGTVGGFAPTGTITFLLTPPGDTFCSATPVFSSVVAVHGSGAYSSANYAPPATGSYKWRAIYSGDNNNLGDGPTMCLNPDGAVTVGTITAAPPANPPAATTATTFPRSTIATPARPGAPALGAPAPGAPAPGPTTTPTTATSGSTPAPTSTAPPVGGAAASTPTAAAPIASSTPAPGDPATVSLGAHHGGSPVDPLWVLGGGGGAIAAFITVVAGVRGRKRFN